MINAGIVGATGYAGEELVDILLRHPDVRIKSVSARTVQADSFADLFPRFRNRLEIPCKKPDLKELTASCDVVFLALPHTVSMQFVPALMKAGKRVIDLSADYRIKDRKVYEKFYKTRQRDKIYLSKAVYGLPEIYRARIKEAKLVANPGCYPTASILALAPLVAFGLADLSSIVIDAKSGVTGAGRKAAEAMLFPEINEDFRAYKVGAHQHSPEINQELSKLAGAKIDAGFVPHLLPVNRGILATVYARRNQKSKIKNQKLIILYEKFYKGEPFVRIRKEGDFPGIKDVAGTNFCDIAVKEDGERVIVISAIDNLLKGASGQAVQNMNIMCGLNEKMGLI